MNNTIRNISITVIGALIIASVSALTGYIYKGASAQAVVETKLGAMEPRIKKVEDEQVQTRRNQVQLITLQQVFDDRLDTLETDLKAHISDRNVHR